MMLQPQQKQPASFASCCVSCIGGICVFSVWIVYIVLSAMIVSTTKDLQGVKAFKDINLASRTGTCFLSSTGTDNGKCETAFAIGVTYLVLVCAGFLVLILVPLSQYLAAKYGSKICTCMTSCLSCIIGLGFIVFLIWGTVETADLSEEVGRADRAGIPMQTERHLVIDLCWALFGMQWGLMGLGCFIGCCMTMCAASIGLGASMGAGASSGYVR